MVPSNFDAESMNEPQSPRVLARYLVTGMTCGHCVASVTEELTALTGVHSVDVELTVGGASTVLITSSSPLDESDVRSAVIEAGYELVVATP